MGSEKITSHFKGSKSGRRSSTGKGKAKVVALVEGARSPRLPLPHPARDTSADPARFLRDRIVAPRAARLTCFETPPSTDDDENTEEAKYFSILKTFDMTTVRESGRRGARPSRNFRPKIYIAIQKMTCPLTAAEADRVPHPSPYHRYRRSTVPRSV